MFTVSCAVAERRAVHGRNRLLRFLGRGHGDEGKAARAATHPVHHEVGFDDRAMGGERLLQVVFGGVEGKISYKQFRAHFDDLLFKTNCFSGLFPTAGFQIITEPGSLEDFP